MGQLLLLLLRILHLLGGQAIGRSVERRWKRRWSSDGRLWCHQIGRRERHGRVQAVLLLVVAKALVCVRSVEVARVVVQVVEGVVFVVDRKGGKGLGGRCRRILVGVLRVLRGGAYASMGRDGRLRRWGRWRWRWMLDVKGRQQRRLEGVRELVVVVMELLLVEKVVMMVGLVAEMRVEAVRRRLWQKAVVAVEAGVVAETGYVVKAVQLVQSIELVELVEAVEAVGRIEGIVLVSVAAVHGRLDI